MNRYQRAKELIDGPILIGVFLFLLVVLHLVRPPLLFGVYAGLCIMAVGAGLRREFEHRLRARIEVEEFGECQRILRLRAGVIVASLLLSISSALTMASIILIAFRSN